MRIFLLVLSVALYLTPRAQAEVPRVVADIAPVYALAAQVMEGVGTPSLIIPQSASPHGYAMRPSEARSLSQAEIVFWVGPALTPWLSKPLETLAGQASHVALMDVANTRLLPFRTGATFDDHDHDHGHSHGHGHGHGDVDEAIDPHAWLDPQNGAVWLDAIATHLARLDPDNADRYRANAEQGQADLFALEQQIADKLSPHRGAPFVVLHDAYHYFEARFGVEAVAAISLGDGAAPSAARLAEVRQGVADSGARCMVTEPGQSDGLIRAIEGEDALTLTTLSPLAPASGALGAGSYKDLLVEMAEGLAGCLSASTSG